MKFLKFKKSNVVSVINFTGIISPNMGRRKGLNIQDYNKLIDNIQPNQYIFTCGSILPYRRLEDVIYGYYHSLNQLARVLNHAIV